VDTADSPVFAAEDARPERQAAWPLREDVFSLTEAEGGQPTENAAGGFEDRPGEEFEAEEFEAEEFARHAVYESADDEAADQEGSLDEVAGPATQDGPEVHPLDGEVETAAGASTESVAERAREALRQGAWSLAATLLIESGVRDRDQLTNRIFHAQHPELRGRSIRSGETELAATWLSIRTQIVDPLLATPGTRAHPRPRFLSEAALRKAWAEYYCARNRMVTIKMFGRWNTLANPKTPAAWRALEQALTATGYSVHRAWIFECRNIAQSSTSSLHAYGLAIDIDHRLPKCNVNRRKKEPARFSPGTSKEERCEDVRQNRADTSFTQEQVAAVLAIRTVEGHQVFTWGGHWANTKDTMHFQINVTPQELERGIRPESIASRKLPGNEAESPDRVTVSADTGESFGFTDSSVKNLAWESATEQEAPNAALGSTLSLGIWAAMSDTPNNHYGGWPPPWFTRARNKMMKGSREVPLFPDRQKYWPLQLIENASSYDVNMDLYSLSISRFPNVNGRQLDHRALTRLVRLQINDFIKTRYASFVPYDQEERAIWESNDPRGAVISIDALGPDNFGIMCIDSYEHEEAAGWACATMITPRHGHHPLSGVRAWGCRKDGTGWEFFTQAIDRWEGSSSLEANIIGLGPIIQRWLWESLIAGITSFIRAHGGEASTKSPVRKTVPWAALEGSFSRDRILLTPP
jgi:D-alanyl-D-alanine carboxypeptidase